MGAGRPVRDAQRRQHGPPHRRGQECSSAGAGIEYAAAVLGVSEIIVCGHSH
ncbi:hypothetical protein GO615_00565 [Aromatoleum evansii]|nr:hypothetical protein [Aromatoleum evansii]